MRADRAGGRARARGGGAGERVPSAPRPRASRAPTLHGPVPGRRTTPARCATSCASFTRVQVFGEVFGFKAGRAKVWFELRDGAGALPCSMWREDFETRSGLGAARRRRAGRRRGRLRLLPGLAHLVAVVLLRGRPTCASPARATCWPSSSGCAARSTPRACSRRRSACRARALPRTIGVVTGERRQGARRRARRACAAAAGPGRRRVGASRRCRTATRRRAITRALQDLAACEEVEVIVVARGGGSLADLFAFCDETLCRTVALLRVPVIASVGHHTDRTLLDDVAAVACSTPTHAAEAAVPVDCARGPRARCARHGRAAASARAAARCVERARALARLSRAPAAPRRPPPHAPAPAAARAARERRAAGSATASARETATRWLERAAGATPAPPRARAAPARSSALRLALAAHDPQRTLERGYALVEDAGRRAGHLRRRGRAQPAPDAAPARRPPCRCVRSRPYPEPLDGREPTPLDLRDRLRADRGDHRAGWTPARPACARRSSCARRAAPGRVLRRRARRRRPRARGAAARRAGRPARALLISRPCRRRRRCCAARRARPARRVRR